MSENQKQVQEYNEDLSASIIAELREDLYSLRVDNNYITKENEKLKAEYEKLKAEYEKLKAKHYSLNKTVKMVPYLYRQY